MSDTAKATAPLPRSGFVQRILCSREHKMREIRTSGSVGAPPGNRRGYPTPLVAAVEDRWQQLHAALVEVGAV